MARPRHLCPRSSTRPLAMPTLQPKSEAHRGRRVQTTTNGRRRLRARALVGTAILGISLLGAAPLTDLKVPTLRRLPDVAEARSLLPTATTVPASIPTRQPGYQLVTNA